MVMIFWGFVTFVIRSCRVDLFVIVVGIILAYGKIKFAVFDFLDASFIAVRNYSQNITEFK